MKHFRLERLVILAVMLLISVASNAQETAPANMKAAAAILHCRAMVSRPYNMVHGTDAIDCHDKLLSYIYGITRY